VDGGADGGDESPGKGFWELYVFAPEHADAGNKDAADGGGILWDRGVVQAEYGEFFGFRGAAVISSQDTGGGGMVSRATRLWIFHTGCEFSLAEGAGDRGGVQVCEQSEEWGERACD